MPRRVDPTLYEYIKLHEGHTIEFEPSTDKFLFIEFFSGHGLVKDRNMCLVTNEFDDL